MLACIACSSKEGGEDDSRAAATTPHSKEAVKSLTSQVPATSISISSEIPTYIFFIESISPSTCMLLSLLRCTYCYYSFQRLASSLASSSTVYQRERERAYTAASI